MSTKPYDEAFKFLAEQDAEGLLLLIGDLRPGQEAEIRLLPREISVSSQLPDQPYEVTTDGQHRLVHIEAQTVYAADLPDRMLDYSIRLWIRYRLPVTSYLLLLTDRKAPKPVPARANVRAGSLRISVRYVPVCLWKLSGRSVLDLKRDSLLPFLPLMKGGNEIMEASAKRLADVPEERKRLDLSLHFLMLGGLRYNRIDLLELIGRQSMIPLEQLKESSFYQYILEEGLEKGLQKGREEGREEGRLEGRRQGEAALLQRILEHRFGQLPDWASRRIASADQSTLEAWGTQVLAAKSLEDLMGKNE